MQSSYVWRVYCKMYYIPSKSFQDWLELEVKAVSNFYTTFFLWKLARERMKDWNNFSLLKSNLSCIYKVWLEKSTQMFNYVSWGSIFSAILTCLTNLESLSCLLFADLIDFSLKSTEFTYYSQRQVYQVVEFIIFLTKVTFALLF